MKNILLLIIFISPFVTFAADIQSYEIDTYIGLYEITDSNCDIPKGSFNPCENTRFFELVKGQFIGVKDTELAYVFWSGYPKNDPELQYTSHLISNHEAKKITDGKFWLNNNGDTQEYLVFSDGILKEYFVKYGSKGKERVIQYKLAPVRRGNLPLYRMNYPGNK